MTDACPVCSAGSSHEVLDLPTLVPVLANRLYEDPSAARSAPMGRTRLLLCHTCGHIWNASFDPALVQYDEGYENSLHFSGVFSSFADQLAQHLVDRFDLHGRTLVEIGSGKGDFLRQLCRMGNNRGIGFDPSYVTTNGEAGAGDADDVSFVSALFPTEGTPLAADFVYARHVLEHLGDPAAVLSGIRRSLDDRDCGLYVEVPDGGHLLAAPAIWDLVYEHPGHFTRSSLAHLLTAAGFGLRAIGTSFGGQFLYADGGTNAGSLNDVEVADELLEAASVFAPRVQAAMSAWGEFLSGARDRGEQVVVWGAGSKGTTFLNIVPGTDCGVSAIVDVNPRKHGRFVPGSGHAVVPPDALSDLAPDWVLVMNPLYVDEVKVLMSDRAPKSAVVTASVEPHEPAGPRG